uniref:Succinate dehydrogenase assembly factor 4, mitochondrial n=1 Tax=Paramoeba aestuarina TaxID=180227 RepID=A0A7S4LA55_9EUKA|mmetsp:Transcript_33807/g.52895  ORF Transcript_33807/g.52895 Transcript_33807/m.52895 type:complete len:106 (-) Transcript_33807:28-345(-)
MYCRRRILLSRAIEAIELKPVTDQRFISQFLAHHKQSQSIHPSGTGVLSDEDVQRLSISTQSPESFFNKKKGISDPSWIVSPEDEKRCSPTRFGDWEKNGRCMDF